MVVGMSVCVVGVSCRFCVSSPESVNKKSPVYQHLQGSRGHVGVVVSRHGHWSVCLDRSWDCNTSWQEQSR